MVLNCTRIIPRCASVFNHLLIKYYVPLYTGNTEHGLGVGCVHASTLTKSCSKQAFKELLRDKNQLVFWINR